MLIDPGLPLTLFAPNGGGWGGCLAPRDSNHRRRMDWINEYYTGRTVLIRDRSGSLSISSSPLLTATSPASFWPSPGCSRRPQAPLAALSTVF